jgi:anti-anti-sigma regulatory factor
MAIQKLPGQALLITLPKEPQVGSELDLTAESIESSGDRDVIVDFSLVEIMPWATICSLMILERALRGAGRQLILCSVPPDVLATFRRAGLQGLFRFADDEFAALQSLDQNTCSHR